MDYGSSCCGRSGRLKSVPTLICLTPPLSGDTGAVLRRGKAWCALPAVAVGASCRADHSPRIESAYPGNDRRAMEMISRASAAAANWASPVGRAGSTWVRR